MDSKPRCRNCYQSGRCNCNRTYPPPTKFASPENIYTRHKKNIGYPYTPAIRNEHSRQRVQSLYDTPCASVVSVDHILKPIRQAEREKWLPKIALTSTTGLSLDGLLCDCCSPKGCKCPHQCPTCGQKVDEDIDLNKKKSSFEKPTLCIACKRCRLGHKCFSRVIHPCCSQKSRQSQTMLKSPCATNKSPPTTSKHCDCRTKISASQCPTPENLHSKQMEITENILKMLLAKRDESFCLHKAKESRNQMNENQSKRFGAGSDRQFESESEELMTTSPVVSSSTDVVETESSNNAIISEEEDNKEVLKGPKKSIQRLKSNSKSNSKKSSSDEFKAFKKDYIVQDVWGMSTEMSKSKYAQISTSKKYISPQTGRVFNLNKHPPIPKIEISDHVIPKPLSIHDLLLLNPRKTNKSSNLKTASPSSFTDKIISSEYMALRGGTDKRKPKAQKNPSDRFRFPNLNSLFSTGEVAPLRKAKNSSYNLSEKSSDTSDDDISDDFLEKQVQEVLQKKKARAGILAQCAGSISNKLANFEDMLRSQLSKDIFAPTILPNSRSTGGQDNFCSPNCKRSQERCECSSSPLPRYMKDIDMPCASFQQKLINFDDMIKTKLSNLIVGRFPDMCDIDTPYCSTRRIKRANHLNLPDLRLPYVGCATRCRKFDDIVKSKLSSLILGRMPEVKLTCDNIHCDECNNSITRASSILYSNTGICEPLDIRRLPCTNIPRALMRFDDIIKAKLSSAIVGTYMNPDQYNQDQDLSQCVSPRRFSAGTSPTIPRQCDSTEPGSPSKTPVIPSTPKPTAVQSSSPPKQTQKDCSPSPSQPTSPRTFTPKPSNVQPPPIQSTSRSWNQPKVVSSKIWLAKLSPLSTPITVLPIPVSQYASPSIRPPTASPLSKVNFDMLTIPCVPSICDMSTCYDLRRKRPCSSFTSICTTKPDPTFDLSLKNSISNKPTCVREFRGPKFDFSCDYNRKRYKSINNNKPGPNFTLPCPFLQCCANCCDRLDRPSTGCKSPPNGANPYLDPNWTASCTDVRNCLSSASSTCFKRSSFELCEKSSQTTSQYLSPRGTNIQCDKCNAHLNTTGNGSASPNKRSCLHNSPPPTPPFKSLPPYHDVMKNFCPRSAPCKSPCNPYMDCNWTSSPSMQCLGCDFSCDSLTSKCCPTRCNDRWCYYYSLEKAEDFIEYPPLPQDTDDYEMLSRKCSDCSIDTIFPLLATHKKSAASTITQNSSSRTLKPEDDISTSELSVRTDIDTSVKPYSLNFKETALTRVGENKENVDTDKGRNCNYGDEKGRSGEKYEDTSNGKHDKQNHNDHEETIHSFYKDTIISYCFISDKTDTGQNMDGRSTISETNINYINRSTTYRESKYFRRHGCNSAGAYQDDFTCRSGSKRNKAKDKFARAIEKICALAEASTTFKRKSKQAKVNLNKDDNIKTNYSVSLTKEIYNIQLKLTHSVQRKQEKNRQEKNSSHVKRKCSSLLGLNRKNNSLINVVACKLAMQKHTVRNVDDENSSWKFVMKHSFPIIRGRVFPTYKPTQREKANRYVRLLKEMSEEYKNYRR